MNKSVKKVIAMCGYVDVQEVKTSKMRFNGKVVGHFSEVIVNLKGTAGNLARKHRMIVQVFDVATDNVKFSAAILTNNSLGERFAGTLKQGIVNRNFTI